MTDEKLIAALNEWSKWVVSGYAGLPAAAAMRDAAARIRELMAERSNTLAEIEWNAEVEMAILKQERDEACAEVEHLRQHVEELQDKIDKAEAEVARLTEYVERNDYIGGWRARAEKAEAEVARLERVAVAAWEFLSDWKKGDFCLPTLAALDAQSMLEAIERLGEERAALNATGTGGTP